MVDFDKILKIAYRLADLVLRHKQIHKDDIKTSILDDQDKDYVIENLMNAEKVKSRNQLEKSLNKTKGKDWQRLRSTIQPPVRKLHYLELLGKIAAISIGVLFIGYYVFGDQVSLHNSNAITKSSHDSITLKLESGVVKVLNGDGSEYIKNNKGELLSVKTDNKLKYNSSTSTSNSSKMVYHELKVPYGRTFEVELSDGTHVHLNAGSTLRYPARFINDGERHVFLDGEGFFDVARDEKNPFVVTANDLMIRVLGTKFVVDSYSEEPNINTVLLEGSVALFKNNEKYDPDKSSLLVPGDLATWDKESKKLSYEEVDPELYTGWVNGKVIFNHMSFSEIIRKLERHYNVTIANHDEKLSSEVFTATFKNETIQDVLKSFSKNYFFEFTMINNRNIIINPQKDIEMKDN